MKSHDKSFGNDASHHLPLMKESTISPQSLCLVQRHLVSLLVNGYSARSSVRQSSFAVPVNPQRLPPVCLMASGKSYYLVFRLFFSFYLSGTVSQTPINTAHFE